ncbi:MAG: DnaJ domain-containing protein [Hyphomicrobiales bacterium]
MPYFLALIAGFVGMAYLSRSFMRSNPTQLAGVARKLVGTGAILLAGFLTLRGGFYVAVPIFLYGLGLLGLQQPFGWPGSAGAGKKSKVETAMLSMELDHDTGTIDGTVVAGRFRGRRLSTLDIADLLALREECRMQTDQSLTLIEAYLDRRDPEWRTGYSQGAGDRQERRSGGRTAMSRREAYGVLGLKEGASEAEIKAAHRRMMKVAHPDHGGSDDLAARINEAKDVLLG